MRFGSASRAVPAGKQIMSSAIANVGIAVGITLVIMLRARDTRAEPEAPSGARKRVGAAATTRAGAPDLDPAQHACLDPF
jgi:hypothetical protein